MFWGFTVRTSAHGFKSAYNTRGSVGVADYIARLAARGFIPNLIVSGIFSLTRTGNIDDTLSEMYSPSGVLESLLGTFSRPLMALTAMTGITSTNEIGYQTSTPMLRDIRNVVRTLKNSSEAVYDGDGMKASEIVLAQFLKMTVPGLGETPFNSTVKEYIKNQ